MTDIRNADGSYMSEDQILVHLHTNTTDKSTIDWLKRKMAPESGESEFFNNYQRGAFSRFIRNSYGMWHVDNPHVAVNDPVNNFEGVITDPRFPDNLSATIVDRLVGMLQEPPTYAKMGVTPMQIAMYLDVTLDGGKQNWCVEADAEKGYITRHRTPVVVEEGRSALERKTGRVVISVRSGR